MINWPLLILILTFAVAFYNVGTIWAMEVDIFRSWQFVDAGSFHVVQEQHWKKLPSWIFMPVGLALLGSLELLWNHPDHSPEWVMLCSVASQLLSMILTALFWGRWQALLSKDSLGAKSPFLKKILRTHWIRTFLITTNGIFLIIWLYCVAHP